MRQVRWLWRATNGRVRWAFSLGTYSLLLGASQLAAVPGSDHILKWVRLPTGLVLVLVGVSQVRTGVMLRRQRRTELLQAVATVVSALEWRRREEASPDQG